MFSMFNYFFKKHFWLPPFAVGRQLCGPCMECPPVHFGVCVNQQVLLNLGKRGMICSGPAPGADVLCYQNVSKRLLSLFLLGQSPHGTSVPVLGLALMPQSAPVFPFCSGLIYWLAAKVKIPQKTGEKYQDLQLNIREKCSLRGKRSGMLFLGLSPCGCNCSQNWQQRGR